MGSRGICGAGEVGYGDEMRSLMSSNPLILSGVLLGAFLGLYFPVNSDILILAKWLILATSMFLVTLALPLLSFGRAISRKRALACLLAVNFFVVPLVAFVLSRVVFQVAELQVGLLLVLLAPGVTFSLVTARKVGGDVESVLGFMPILFLGQLFLVPLLTVFLSGGVLRISDITPAFGKIGLVIGVPFFFALAVQLTMARFDNFARLRPLLENTRGPVIALGVVLVLWLQLPQHFEKLELLYSLVPLFFAFLVLLAPLSLLAGILFGLTSPEKRAIMVLGAGRGSAVMLPLALSLDQESWGLVSFVVIVQMAMEVLGLMVYRTIVPEIVQSE